VLQNTLSSTGLSRGISFFLLLDTTEPPCHTTSLPASLSPTSSGLLPCRYPKDLQMRYVPFFLPLLLMLSSFLLSFFPRRPRRSALPVLLFYCGTPRCCLMSSVPLDLRLFRYLITYASLLTAHCCAYCGHYSPIGSRSLEPALIPLWTPLRSSNHTIYTVPLSVTSL